MTRLTARGFRRFKGFRGFRGEGIAFGDEYIVSVTGLAFVSPVLHDEEQKTEEQRGLDDRSQKSDVRLRYVLNFPPDTVILSVSEESRYVESLR